VRNKPELTRAINKERVLTFEWQKGMKASSRRPLSREDAVERGTVKLDASISFARYIGCNMERAAKTKQQESPDLGRDQGLIKVTSTKLYRIVLQERERHSPPMKGRSFDDRQNIR
jgi:hypothetical protein